MRDARALSAYVRLVERPTALTRVALAIAAAVLFALCFPPAGLGFLGWIALVPLALAVRGLRASRAAALGGVFGIVSAHLVFGWLFRFDEFHVQHGLVLAGYVALYPALVSVAMARWAFEPRGLLYVPAATAAIEWGRGHAGFLALPWASFGQTQHRDLPLLQLAAYGGEPLVGILVVVANVALVQLLVARARSSERRMPALVIGVVLGAHLLGVGLLAREIEGEELSVAAVQPAILPRQRDAAHREEQFARLVELSKAAGAANARLVVWPETAVGSIEADLVTKLAIRDVVEEIGAPIVFGSSEIEKLVRTEPLAHERKSFNAAFAMSPGLPVPPPYLKVKLLPFAEYRPLDLPEWVAPRMFETERGERHATLDAAGVVVEPIICWENLFADDVRATAADEPSIIAHLVNDAWFGPTAQPELHNLVSAFRAAESGRPLVLASNTGPSWIVDAHGRVVARTPRAFEPAVVTASVRMPGGQTPYRRFGDRTWAVPLSVAVALVSAARARLARKVSDAAT